MFKIAGPVENFYPTIIYFCEYANHANVWNGRLFRFFDLQKFQALSTEMHANSGIIAHK